MRLVLVARILFGAWMLASGLNHFFLELWPEPVGHQPLAIQLLDAFTHSGLLNVAMVIELVTGALILLGRFTPAALCVLMPVSTCALYWSLVLDHQPLTALLALVAFGLNGVLMLCHLDYYHDALRRDAPSLGEREKAPANYDALFASPGGPATRAQFVPALIVLIAVALFYVYLVTGRTATFCLLVLMVPGLVLHARRLRDMGRSAWLLALPALLLLPAFAIWLKYASFGGHLDSALPMIALLVAAAFALWGAVGSSQPATSR